MYNTVLLKVLDSLRHLLNNFAHSLFRKLVVSLLKIIIQILSFAVLKDDEVVALVLKEVYKPDNVRVLAHLKDVNLSP